MIAHRGASAELPENTLPAFERAIELGADFVELDVHARADGELVVTHDAPRRRAPLPTLAEVLDLCRGRIGVMVELKTPYRYRRHRLIERTLALLDDDAVVVCFEPGRRPGFAPCARSCGRCSTSRSSRSGSRPRAAVGRSGSRIAARPRERSGAPRARASRPPSTR